VKPPTRERFRSSGGELSYVDAGEGRPVVLLHGFPTSSYLWRREVAMFASRMRVIAPDLLGYGESEKPNGPDLSIRAQAAYLGELLADLGLEEAAIVGHGAGGGIAQLLATTGLVRSLVLVDSVAFDAWPSEAIRSIQRAGLEAPSKDAVERFARGAVEAGVEHTGALTPADVDAYVAPWLVDPGAFFRAARALDGEGLRGVEANLRAHGLPVFVIWGEADVSLPASLAERLLDELPGSTVALLPGCGHLVTEDAPTTVGPLIYEFLRRWYLGESHSGHPVGAAPPVPAVPVQVFLDRPPTGSGDDPYTHDD
jgi:pimeloyl-ACP methyl ester carboxylesterase